MTPSFGRLRVWFLGTLLATLASAGVASVSAQELRLGSVHARTSDDRWGNPSGWGLAFQYPANDYVTLLVGVSATSDRRNRVGQVCANCPTEQLDNHARLLDLRAGLAGTVFRARQVAVAVTGDLRWVEGTSDTRAQQTARFVSTSPGYWGPSLGVDLSWKPSPAGAFGVFVAAQSVWWRPRNTTGDPDVYDPFTTTVQAPSVSAGISWAVRLRASDADRPATESGSR